MEPALPQVPMNDTEEVSAQQYDSGIAPPRDDSPIETPRFDSEFSEAMQGRLSAGRKSFQIENSAELVNNDSAKALQRGNSVISCINGLEDLHSRAEGVIDWNKPRNLERLREVRSLIRRLFWAFRCVETEAEDVMASEAPAPRSSLSSMGSLAPGPSPGFRKAVRRVVNGEVFQGCFLLLTVYALFGPDVCAIYGKTALNTEDKTLAVINTVVLAAFVIEEVLHSIGIPGYVCSVRFWIDTLATFSIIGDSVIGTEFLQSDAFVAMRGSRLSRILRVGGRSSKLVRVLRMTRLVQIIRLIPRLQEWLQRSTNELAFSLWHKRVHHIARFLDVEGTGKLTAQQSALLCTAMELEFPEVKKESRARKWVAALSSSIRKLRGPSTVVDYAWSTRSEEPTYGEMVEEIITSPVGKRAYQRCREEIEGMKDSCAIVEDASGRLTLKVCILVLMLLLVMQILLAPETDFTIIQGLHQVDALAAAKADPVAPTSICDFIREQYAKADPSSQLLLLAANNVLYWRPGCECCAPDKAAASPYQGNDLVAGGGYPAIVVSNTGLEAHEIEIAEVDTGDLIRSLVIFDVSIAQRDMAMNSVLQTLVVVILLTSVVVYFSTDMKKLSNDNVLHPLWDLMDDMCSLQCIELLANPHVVEDQVKTREEVRALFRRHLSKAPHFLKNAKMPACQCCANRVNTAEELHQLRGAFDKLRMAISSWSKYVPLILLKRLIEEQKEANIGCTFCEVCVVFLAIADFDTVCEDLDAKEVLELMSGVLTGIYDALEANNGVMLEFIGDEVLAVFNAPNQVTAYQQRAISAALEAQDNVRGFKSDVSLQCSVHKARVLVGNLGSPTRMKYGVLGDGVNLSARLKSLNTRYRTRLLVSAEALEFESALDHFVFRPVGNLILKGRTTPTRTFEVMAKRETAPEHIIQSALNHSRAFDLYCHRSFQEAKALFSEVDNAIWANDETSNSGDKVSQHMLQLCDKLIASPPGEDWDGSEHLTKKSFS